MDNKISWQQSNFFHHTYFGFLGTAKVAEIKKSLFSPSYRLKFFLTESATPFEDNFPTLNACWNKSEDLLGEWLISSCLPVKFGA